MHAPSGPDMDAKLGDAVAHRLHVAGQTSLEPLDSRDDNAPNRGVCQMVEPRAEFRECLDAEHGGIVIERLHTVEPARSDPRER